MRESFEPDVEDIEFQDDLEDLSSRKLSDGELEKIVQEYNEEYFSASNGEYS